MRALQKNPKNACDSYTQKVKHLGTPRKSFYLDIFSVRSSYIKRPNGLFPHPHAL